MTITLRKVTKSDMDKFPVWYNRIGGSELFSNFMPSSFVSFEESEDLLWFIINHDNDEIGTIWFEKFDLIDNSCDLGIYLNNSALLGIGIGKTVMREAIKKVAGDKKLKKIFLDVRQNNIRAIRCYESLGFVTIHTGEKKSDRGNIEFQRMKLLITYS